MTVHLPASIAKELLDLALQQRRGVDQIVEEAVVQYLEAASITDVSGSEVAETQAALVGEMRGISG
jgi:hypothetical protein